MRECCTNTGELGRLRLSEGNKGKENAPPTCGEWMPFSNPFKQYASTERLTRKVLFFAQSLQSREAETGKSFQERKCQKSPKEA